jgi:hypothetical protein
MPTTNISIHVHMIISALFLFCLFVFIFNGSVFLHEVLIEDL